MPAPWESSDACACYSNVVAVGMDLTNVSDVRDSIGLFGERYLRRLFTAAELADCYSVADPIPRIAARFAAKEATVKALKVDGSQPVWTSMEVWRHPLGGCDEMRLTGAAARLAADQGVGRICVSLGHEADAAIAVVVATRAHQFGPATISGGTDVVGPVGGVR